MNLLLPKLNNYTNKVLLFVLLLTSTLTFAQEKSSMIEVILHEYKEATNLAPIKDNHEVASIKGKGAWKLNKKEGSTLSYLYLDLNDKLFKVKGQTLTITLEYLSKGPGYIQFKYDSYDQKVKVKNAESGAWKLGKQVNFTKQNKWLTTTFTVEDARFNKNCDKHSIAIIAGSEEDVYVRSLKFSRDPSSAPKVIASISATLGNKATFNKVIAIKGNGETVTAPITIDGKEAWDIKSKKNNQLKMVYFDVNAKNFIAGGEKLYAYLEYLDRGNGNAVIFYDSKDQNVNKNPKAKPGAWKKAHGFKLTNSGKWKKAYFELADARFEKNCNGHDIRINFNSDNKAIISRLKFAKNKDELNKEATAAGVNQPQGISATLGETPVFDNIQAIRGGNETQTKPITINGKSAWDILSKANNNVKMIYFDVKSKEYINGDETIYAYLEYLDQGNGTIALLYDSKDESVKRNPKAKPGSWKKAHAFKLTNTGKWKKAYFEFPDARFQKNCNGHDIRININSDDKAIIHRLKFAKSKEALNSDGANGANSTIIAAASLGKKPTFTGLIAIRGGNETITEPINIEEVEAWNVKSKANNNVKMLYFDVKSKEIVKAGKIYAYLEYLDLGTGNAALLYDSKDESVKRNPKAKPGSWKKAHGFKFTNTGKWKKTYFEIADARFQKNCNGHDIRINFNSNDKVIIKEMKFSNSKEGLNKKVVTTAAAKVKKPAVKMNTKHSKTFNFSTADMKVYTGYQGWFNTPGDGSGLHWKHYQKNARKGDPLSVENIRVDAWPDLTEFPKSAKYDTPFKHKDGATAQLFSSADPITQDIHFRWMKEYNIDAAFVQRFVTSAAAPHINPNLNKVLVNSLEAAKKHKRGVAIMYDLSGMKGDQGVASFIKDWKELVDNIKLTTKYKDVYLSTNGKPLVAIWGVGFDPQKKKRKYYLEDCERIIDFLQNDPVYGGCSVLLGVPTRWRDGVKDATSDPLFHELVKRSDIVLPWYTGRVKTGRYNEIYPIVEGDVTWCKNEKLGFMPVLFPGFSWHNMNPDTKLNQTPREKGQFFWNQMHGAAKAGAEMVYIGMFDEIDEATCFFKITSDIPVGLEMIDNEGLPSDHYLWLVKEGRKMLGNPSKLKAKMPERKLSN
ncbi:glycoside hydrolase family 71/99-like protein [Flammeovirga kamogawensis]|uniref:Carbohydrate-binding domain-containing protein n=1 Tax=Flammeovirga kamogawensis TaxID=373891 RepID=A0ABX8H2W1_9BACT|nr:glycoside hydrolase family 71/99-like protein [Flammeovirga kamogawensis]MBB6460449.1 putative lipoprotein NlpE involved in copper resistance [Flammeovirga kamogawensis]QWG10254.1 hypothetical protein KM029_21465 [Flammeovirga kamogawensis]TRX64703.1 hypothetical protein EO216_19390 [Flammeovirga kamogawensis]